MDRVAVLLLLMGIFFALLLPSVSTKGAGGGRTQAKKKTAEKLETSLVRITDKTLESHYVQFLFDPMEAEARKSLELKMGEFLLRKQKSGASSSSGGVKVGGSSGKTIKGAEAKKNVADAEASNSGEAEAEKKKAEAQQLLLAQLHLTELKAIFVPKKENKLDKSVLANRFMKAPFSREEEVLEAKARMRALVGDQMFLELEMREPFFLRIYDVEQSEYLAYFEKILSVPVAEFLATYAICRLYIPIMVDYLLQSMVATFGSMENVREEFGKFWRKHVLGELASKNSIITEAALQKLALQIYMYNFVLLQGEEENAGIAPDKVDQDEKRRICAQLKAMALVLFRQPECRLPSFIRRTRGARARLYKFLALDENERFDEFLAWTESDLLARLMQEYILSLTGKAKSAAERLKSKISADILVQVSFLDKHFEGNEAIMKAEWLNLRHACLFHLDKIVDEDEDYAKDYGNMFKYMLYKLRTQLQSTSHWNHETFFKMQKQIRKQWLGIERSGKKRPQFLIGDQQEAKAQDQWLEKEHATMVEQLQQEHAEFRRKMKGVDPTRFKALVGSHMKQKDIQVSEGGQNATSYHKCPKEWGFFLLKPDDKLTVYVEYLFTKNPQIMMKLKGELGLDALANVYKAVIMELFGAYPTKNVEKLREDWQLELVVLLETEESSIKAGMDRVKAKNHSLCKVHAFLLNRLVKAELPPEVDDAERNNWHRHMREVKITEIFMKLLAEDPDYGNFDPNCEPEVAQVVVETLITEQIPMDWPHFFYLDELINGSDVFRRCICQVIDRLQAKERIKELMGADYFSEIEIMHPEILQIDNMLPSSRMEYYDAYLDFLRFDQEFSHVNEVRMAVPLLVGKLREIEAVQSSEKHGGKEALAESHVDWLLGEIFSDREQLVSERSVCLLSRFIVWSNASRRLLATNKAKGKQVATAEAGEPSSSGAYSKESELVVCAKIETQLKALNYQRKMLAENHREFLKKHPIDTTILGRKTALQRLVPGLHVVWKAEDYTDHAQFGVHFLEAIFMEENRLILRLSATFGVYFGSWHRWMTAELRAGRGPEFELFNQIWTRWQPQLLSRHDALFCADLPSQMRAKEFWAKMQAGLKDFLLQISTMNKKGKIPPPHTNISTTVVDLFMGKDPQWNARWNLELWTEFNQWVQQRNRAEFLQLISEGDPEARGMLRQQILERFLRFPEAKGRLNLLIGNDPDHHSIIEESLGIKLASQDSAGEIDFMKAEHEIDLSSLVTNEETEENSDQFERTSLQIWAQNEQETFNKMVDEYPFAAGETTHAESAEVLDPLKSKSEPGPMDLETTNGKEADLLQDQHGSIEFEAPKSSAEVESPKETEIIKNDLSGKKDSKGKKRGKNARKNASKKQPGALGSPKTIGELPAHKLISGSQKSSALKLKSLSESRMVKQLQQVLEEKGWLENYKQQKGKAENIDSNIVGVKEAIGRLRTAIHHWDNEAFLLLTGSYQLGLYADGSDIDCLVVLPHGEDQDWEMLYREHFLGHRQHWRNHGGSTKDGVRGKDGAALNPYAPEFQPTSVHATSSAHNMRNFRSALLARHHPLSGHTTLPAHHPFASLSYLPTTLHLPVPTVMGPPRYHRLPSHINPMLAGTTGSGGPVHHHPVMVPPALGGPRRFARSPTGPSGSTERGQEEKEAEEEEEEEEEIICEIEDRHHCPNWSLYCMLCQNKEVKSLVRIPGQFPLIRINFYGFNFKLGFVTFSRDIWMHVDVENVAEGGKDKEDQGKGIGLGGGGGGGAYGEIRILKKGELINEGEEEMAKEKADEANAPLRSLHSVDRLICAFVDAVDVFEFINDKTRKGMLLALSGYRANLRILELLGAHSKETFRLGMLTLKRWASGHFIAGGQFGMLNGTTLTLMFVHIFLQHPEETAPALLAHFFDVYSRWNWPTPVELEPSAAAASGWNRRDRYRYLLDWSAAGEEADHERQLNLDKHRFLDGYAKLVWPVLSPGLPRQNAAFNINAWTAQAMSLEFAQSLKELQNFHGKLHEERQLEEEVIKEKWTRWLNLDGVVKFENKYAHFLTILCAYDQQQKHGAEFCDFVESRIRLQLLIAFGDIEQVEFMHANHNKIWHNRACPQQILQQKGTTESFASSIPYLGIEAGDLCTLWLVGIQMKPTVLIRESIRGSLSPEFIAQEIGQEKHVHRFVEPIRESFNKQQEVAGRKMMAQKLTVKYYRKEDLDTLLLA